MNFFSRQRMAFCLFLLSAALTAAPAVPDYYWSADNTAEIQILDGKRISPLKQEGVTYAPGIQGEAFRVDGIRDLRYSAEKMFEDKGSLSFWIAPGFNGWESRGVYCLLMFLKTGGAVTPFSWMHIYQGTSFYIPTESADVENSVRFYQTASFGDWMHFAVTWGDRNWCTVYCNGRPVSAKRFSGTDFSRVKELIVGTVPGKWEPFKGCLDEIKLYKKVLAPEEIFAEYASHAVFDFVCDREVFPAGEKITPELVAAPLGRLHGNMLPSHSPEPSAGDVTLSLLDDKGKTLSEKQWKSLKVSDWTTLQLPSVALPPGTYRLVARARNGTRTLQSTFRLIVSDMKPEVAPSGELHLGKPFFTKSGVDFAAVPAGKKGALDGKSYLEASDKKDARIFCEVDIPEEYANGRRLAVEIEWPDDKPRAMGLYLYPPRDSGSQIRDRLGGGIAAGNEFSNSGEMRKCRYFFHAGHKKYLFEARTMIGGAPGAIASLTVRPVEGPLPKLDVRLPKGLPGRSIGHLDEDQSFDYNLDWDNTRPKFKDDLKVDPKILKLLREYYAYTGQNFLALPLLRYDFTNYTGGPYRTRGGAPPFSDAAYWADSLAKDAIDFVAIFNLMSPPELQDARQKRAFAKKGMFTATPDGIMESNTGNNPVHPENRRLILSEVRDFMVRFGKMNNLKGIDLWLEWGSIGFRDLEHGYDDFTVSLFSKETGVKVPEFTESPYKKRYEFLTAEPQRTRWLAWRAEKTTEMIRAVRKEIDQVRPDLPLYVSSMIPFGEKQDMETDSMDVVYRLYENKGIDLKSIGGIRNTTFVPMRDPLHGLWQRHWDGTVIPCEETLSNAVQLRKFRNPEQNFVNSYRRYFETFSASPMQDRYPGTFQNIDLKGNGRFFLKDLIECLVFTDAQRIAVGAQPLASLGREDEMREFVRAYRALPALPFTDIPKAEDPVTARYLPTDNGTYLYAASRIHGECEIVLKIPDVSAAEDLSDGHKTEVKNGLLSIRLKPFELRSFLIPGKVNPVFETVNVSGAYKKELDERIAHFEKMLEAMGKNASPPAASRIALCRKLFAQGAYAEVHRLLFSKIVLSLESDAKAYSAGYIQQQRKMLEESHIAVNCGSPDFFRTASGALFFPDQPWSASSSYGYAGKIQTVIRSTDAMPENELKELFLSEAYKIGGYKFRLPEGRYTLKMLMRLGYNPSRKTGTFVVNVSINGKSVKKDFDIFKAEDPKTGFCTLTFQGMTPVNGVLSVGIEPADSRDPSICLLNAIEVTREK